jgi:catechol 1,2-dioxygenase
MNAGRDVGIGGEAAGEEGVGAEITQRAVTSFEDGPDQRLGVVMRALVWHLHQFVAEVGLTQSEWEAGIRFLTETGQMCDDKRQEFILLSDVLGVSMLVDAIAHSAPPNVTESTVLGPFYAAGSPTREYGKSIAERPSGESAWIWGTVHDSDGQALAGAELDVWQNADNGLYAVQDPESPEFNLRGRFCTRSDGSYGFLTVRPVDYAIPSDGPVGRMLAATGRHPWRPGHVHMIVSAPGFAPVATHVFDSASTYLGSDAVFAEKASLVRIFEPRSAEDPERPPGVSGRWWSVRNDIVLARASSGVDA